jgi:GT2 family glycosyltransferase
VGGTLSMLSIVIVNYRSWTRLGACLDSIRSQHFSDIQVIVVDNYSNDGEADRFVQLHPEVEFILQHHNGGFAQANNAGARCAKGDWLLFLNPDTVLPQGVLNQLLQRASHEPEWKLIGIRQFNDGGKDTHPHGVFLKWWNVWPPMRAIERLFRPDQSRHSLSTTPVAFPDWISGSFVLIRKNDFEVLGGWDERFWMYYEDMDLSKRAAEKGWARVMYNELNCIHAHGGSSRINSHIKAMTKSTVVLSAQGYIQKHFSGLSRALALMTLWKITFLELLITLPFSAYRRNMFARLFLNR